jgi:hypothetical protein
MKHVCLENSIDCKGCNVKGNIFENPGPMADLTGQSRPDKYGFFKDTSEKKWGFTPNIQDSNGL